MPGAGDKDALVFAGIELANGRIRELQAGIHRPVGVELSKVQGFELRFGSAADRPVAQVMAGLVLVAFGVTIIAYSEVARSDLDGVMAQPPQGVVMLCVAFVGAMFNVLLGAWAIARAVLPRQHVRLSTAHGFRRLAFRRILSAEEVSRFESALTENLSAHRRAAEQQRAKPAIERDGRGRLSGITADSAAKYLARLDAEEDAAIRDLEKALAAALTQDERHSVRTRMKQVREDFARRKRAADQSLF